MAELQRTPHETSDDADARVSAQADEYLQRSGIGDFATVCTAIRAADNIHRLASFSLRDEFFLREAKEEIRRVLDGGEIFRNVLLFSFACPEQHWTSNDSHGIEHGRRMSALLADKEACDLLTIPAAGQLVRDI